MKLRRTALTLPLLLAGAALAAPVIVTDGLRRTVTVDVPARRVVALSPTVTEIMLDAGLVPVGRPSSAVFPEAATRLIPQVGSAYAPDLERILAQRPDLLLGSVGTTAARARELGSLSVPLVVARDSSLQDVYDAYSLVGRLTGQEAQARLARRLLESRVERVLARVPKQGARPKVLALLAAGGQAFSTTDETYVGDLLEKLGAQNVAKGTPSPDPRQPGFVTLSLEQIVAANPDVILGFRSRGANGQYAPSPLAALESQPAYQNLAAVRNGRVHLLDADPFVTAPGPRAVESLTALLPLLYPRGR